MAASSDRRVTAADVARALGISRATVGFVLNDTPGQKISSATRARVRAEAERLGYRPHQAARALASGQTRIVLLILPDWPLEYSLSTHLEEASLALDEAGYSLITWTKHASGKARPLWEVLQPDVVMSLTPLDPDTVAAIRRGGSVVVHPGDPSALSESSHNVGPRLQVEHLVDRGHTRIIYVESADPRVADLVAERVELAAATAEALGVTLAREVVNDVSPARVAGWAVSGLTAVAGYNDEVAARVLGAALRAGLRVPAQLAIVGHDDAPISRLLLPPLSTVRVDNVGLGRFFATVALRAAGASPSAVSVPATHAELLVRAST